MSSGPGDEVAEETGASAEQTAPRTHARGALPIIGFVFLGALLLFGLEPLTGRLLLPHFGGGFHVWTTALMFFQGALFFAYLYAHLIARRAGAWHLLLVALGLVALPPSVDSSGAAQGSVAILWLLFRSVALPFTILATTAVVAQGWWARSRLGESGKEPYALYAVSNAGSLGSLLLYALAVEPLIGLTTQRWAWSAGYLAYLALGALTYFSLRPSSVERVAEEDTERLFVTTILYWATLSAAPSMFLMAVTNLIALDAGSVPLVWVLPLAIYLGSFVIAFATKGQSQESLVPGFVRRLWPHVSAVGLFFFTGGDAGGGWLEVAVQLTVLAFVSSAAHAELHRVRPAPRKLTSFYLVLALGGWIGGAVVALLAPAFFDGLWEYPLALVLLASGMFLGRRKELTRRLRNAPKLAWVASLALLAVIAFKVVDANRSSDDTDTIEVRRSFYGLYRVTETPRQDDSIRDLVSGSTRHGRQRAGDSTPLSYYHPEGPLGDGLGIVPSPRRIGVVGLGVGAATGHLREGDHIRFFEIDGAVVDLAEEHFTYLDLAPDRTEVVVGDARLSLAEERDRGEPRYDVLLIDAFSGDAIPTHLLTVEALSLYLERLEDDGLLLLHVSNRYYDLHPALAATANELGLAGLEIARVDNLARDQDPSQYVALARAPARLEGLTERGWTPLRDRGATAWTDDHVNVMAALLAGLER